MRHPKNYASHLENSNGDGSYDSLRLWFNGGVWVGRMALFRVGPISIGMWEKKTMREE